MWTIGLICMDVTKGIKIKLMPGSFHIEGVCRSILGHNNHKVTIKKGKILQDKVLQQDQEHNVWNPSFFTLKELHSEYSK